MDGQPIATSHNKLVPLPTGLKAACEHSVRYLVGLRPRINRSKDMHALKYLLAPISALYSAGLKLRNSAYDAGWKKSFAFDIPLIVVGNLAMGGTGKSPHVEYLVELLSDQYKLATLSRGYGRKTRGFLMATPLSLAEDIGDEPLQFKKRFPDLEVGVCEQRVEGVPNLLANVPELDLIILDDAFQHRKLKAGLNILLTTWDNPWTSDHLFPMGGLREGPNGARRADMVMVSKCPPQINADSQRLFAERLGFEAGVNCYFSGLKYGHAFDIWSGESHILQADDKVVLVTGIANAKPLEQYVGSQSNLFRHIERRDHHTFTASELEHFASICQKAGENAIILTTTKDAGRLTQFKEISSRLGLRIFAIDLKVDMLPDSRGAFENRIQTWVNNNVASWRTVRDQLKE